MVNGSWLMAHDCWGPARAPRWMFLRMLFRWPLDVSFQAPFSKQRMRPFLLLETGIWQARWLRLGTQRDYFGSLAAPCGTKGAAEGTPWHPESDFLRF